MYIVKWPFNKQKFKYSAVHLLEKSFRMMYSNIGLSFRWTLPLNCMLTPCEVFKVCNVCVCVGLFNYKMVREGRGQLAGELSGRKGVRASALLV